MTPTDRPERETYRVDERRPCSRCNGSGTEPDPGSITAEAWRQLGADFITRYGWQCLRCGDEATMLNEGSAEWQQERAEYHAQSHRCSVVAANLISGVPLSEQEEPT